MSVAADSNAVNIADCGCLTPLGDASATHAALVRGERALRPVPVGGQAGGDPVPVALLPGRTLDETAPPFWLTKVDQLLAPTRDGNWGSGRRPVFVTSSNFGVGNLHAYRCGDGDPAHLAYGAPFTFVDVLRRHQGWGENIAIFSHACVSAHLGLLQASRIVEAGLADDALVVSLDFVSPFVAGGFHALKILNADFPAPYQERATGSIGLGDGAAYAIVSRRAGGFPILGQSLYNEMHHFTANKPDGSGFAACLQPLRSRVDGRRIWLKGHGTGTLEAGRLEATTLSSVMPGSPLVGWKGSLGHTLGSCGLVELAVAVESIRRGVTPGTVGSAAPSFSPSVALQSFNNAEFDAVLCASNAFGGAHACLLLGHD